MIIEPLNHFDVLGGVTIHLATIVVTVYKLCRKYRMNKQIALKEKEAKEKAEKEAQDAAHSNIIEPNVEPDAPGAPDVGVEMQDLSPND